MSTLSITGDELLKGLSYITSAVGSKTTSKQDLSLVYMSADLNEDTVTLQAQSSMFIASTKIAHSGFTSTENVKALVDYNSIYNYVKNNSKSSLFEFDFSKVDDDDLLTISIGTKFIGEVLTFPIDAYELEVFDNTTKLTSVSASKFQKMTEMSCQFANFKQDIQDYMQLIGKDDKLIFFTSDVDVVAEFETEETLENDFNITVKSSALRGIRSFTGTTLDLSKDEDGYYLIITDDSGFRAVAVHSDPPQSYEELDEIDPITHSHGLSWAIPEMQQALRNLENSSKYGKFSFNLVNDYTLKVFSEGFGPNSTKIELNAVIDNFQDELSSENYTCGIDLFRKLSNVAKKTGKVTLDFSLNEEDPDDTYIQFMQATGTESNIDYTVTFSVV